MAFHDPTTYHYSILAHTSIYKHVIWHGRQKKACRKAARTRWPLTRIVKPTTLPRSHTSTWEQQNKRIEWLYVILKNCMIYGVEHIYSHTLSSDQNKCIPWLQRTLFRCDYASLQGVSQKLIHKKTTIPLNGTTNDQNESRFVKSFHSNFLL